MLSKESYYDILYSFLSSIGVVCLCIVILYFYQRKPIPIQPIIVQSMPHITII